MAKNYNQRSGSLDSRNGNTRPAGKNRPASRRVDGRHAQGPGTSSRSKVDYVQSAKIDLASKGTDDDPRMRYVKYRADKDDRVLGRPEESRFRNRDLADPRVDASYRTRAGGPEEPDGLDGLGAWDSRRTQGGAPRGGSRRQRGSATGQLRQQQRASVRPRSNLPARLLIVVVILLVLLGGGFAVYMSPLFAIQKVDVEGAQHLTSDNLTQLAAIPQGSTLLRADFTGIQDRIKANTWVESVEIHRSFPSTLVINVTERKIAAVVDFPSADQLSASTYWLISDDGVWLGSYVGQPGQATTGTGGTAAAGTGTGDTGAADATTAGTGDAGAATADTGDASADTGTGTTADAGGSASDAQGTSGGANDTAATTTGDTGAANQGAGTQGAQGAADSTSVLADAFVSPSEIATAVHITDVSKTLAPQIGQTITDEGILNALAIINGFSPTMLSQLQSISAPDQVKTTLTLTNNVGVAFGAADDVATKEKVILALLDEHPGTLTYINVRVADRATYRATE